MDKQSDSDKKYAEQDKAWENISAKYDGKGN